MKKNATRLNKLNKNVMAVIIVMALVFTGFIGAFSKAFTAAAVSSGPIYESDFDSRKDVRENGLALNERVMEEGAVLLKNEGGILPLKPNSKLSVFGKNGAMPNFSGTGSSAQGLGANQAGITFYNAMENAGFSLNPTLKNFYTYSVLDGTRTVYPYSGAFRPSPPTAGAASIFTTGYAQGETRATGNIYYNDGYNPLTDTAMKKYDGSGGWKTVEGDIKLVSPDINSETGKTLYDPTNQTPGYSNYNVSVEGTNLRSTYSAYGDTAIVYFQRMGGEGYDPPQTMLMGAPSGTADAAKNAYGSFTTEANVNKDAATSRLVPGARYWDDHYLQLDVNETNVLKEACAYFDNVVVILNSATPMELGFLDDPAHYAYNSKIKAAMWIATPAENGLKGVASLLKGDANPSGSLVDTYYREFENDPTWFNFSKNRTVSGNRYQQGTTDSAYYFVDYQEDIYLGYRYYETRYAEILKADGKEAADTWYKKNVVYPYGYGLSYTDFSMEITGQKFDNTAFANGGTVAVTGASEIQISVKIKNTGNVAGKKTVQLYGKAPYTAGGIEKSDKVFIGFGKTDTLKPGQSQTITVSAPVYYLASYDWSDANKNTFKGYELEASNYSIFAAENAHDSSHKVDFTVAAPGIKIENDPVTGTKVENQFDDSSNHMAQNSAILSRANNFANYDKLTNLSTRRSGWSQEFITKLSNQVQAQNNRTVAELFEETGAPLISKIYPATQTATALTYANTPIKWADMYGVDYDDSRWDLFMDQLTFTQYATIINSGSYHSAGLENIGKPPVRDWDGPVGWNPNTSAGANANPGVTFLKLVSTCLVAATMNEELQFLYGQQVGEEGLWGNSFARGSTTNYTSADTTNGAAVSGWYGPAANIHRSPFSGRNFEYFSEDGILSGITLGNLVTGAQDKGVYSWIKHYFLNDQETDRQTQALVTWATEQAMREIYARAFEIAIKMSNKWADNNGREPMVAIMSSFARVGAQHAGGSYAVMTQLPRNEWGMRGAVITDYNLAAYQDMTRLIIAGNDKSLSNATGNKAAQTTAKYLDDATYGNTYKWKLRIAAKNILYTTANSNSVNTAYTVYAADATLSAVTVGAAMTSYDLKTLPDTNKPVAQHYGSKNRANYTYKYELAPGYKVNTDPWAPDPSRPTDPTLVAGSAGDYTPTQPNAFPAGLSMSSAGVISGTPVQAGTFQVAILVNVSEDVPAVAIGGKEVIPARTVNYVPFRQIITIQVTTNLGTVDDDIQLPASVFLGMAAYGINSSFTIPNYQANGGGFTYTYALTQGTVLPAGLTFNATTGVVSGTPTAGQGTYTYWFYVKYQKTETANPANKITNAVMLGIQIGAPYDDTAIRDMITGLENQIKNIKSDISSLDSDISAIQSDIGKMSDDIKSLQAEIAVINGKITTINGNITTINGLITGLQSSLNGLETKMNSEIAALKTELAKEEGLLGELKDSLAALTTRVNALEEKGCNSSVNMLGGFAVSLALIILAGALVFILIRRPKKD